MLDIIYLPHTLPIRSEHNNRLPVRRTGNIVSAYCRSFVEPIIQNKYYFNQLHLPDRCISSNSCGLNAIRPSVSPEKRPESTSRKKITDICTAIGI